MKETQHDKLRQREVGEAGERAAALLISAAADGANLEGSVSASRGASLCT